MPARVLLAAIAPLSALVFWRAGYDVFLTVKSTVVVVAVLLLVVMAAVTVVRSGRVALPPMSTALPLAAFVAALMVATLAADRPLLALVGRAGRHTGLALALAAVLVLVAAAAVFRDGDVGLPVATLLWSAVPVIGYALVQVAGADPISWVLVEGGPPVFSTLGNASFLSGWLGIVATLAVGAALACGWRARWRVAAVALAASALVTAALTGSVQGVVAGGVGLVVVGFGWVASRPRSLRPAQMAGALAAAVSAVAVALLLVPGGAWQQIGAGVTNRFARWEVAWRMAADHPWLGVGLAHFASYAPRYASPEAAAARGLERILDDPHDVPLAMLAGGGWPLLVCWVAVVAGVFWVAVAGWRRGDERRRLVITGLVGAWAAYLVQALVSIDVAPLVVTGWLLAGLVVAAAGTVHEMALPTSAVRPAAAVVGLAALVLVPLAVVPLTADVEAARAIAAERRDAPQEAAARYESATMLGSWEARYAMLEGSWWTREGAMERARQAFDEAHQRDPGAVAPVLNSARLSIALGDVERARAAYATVLRLAPASAQLRDEASAYLDD